jgi:hypothetical protein
VSPTDSTIVNWATGRGETEILHFTTNKGLIGILAYGSLLSRDQLREEELLTEIAVYNAPNRCRDADWTGWVNLSITTANSSFMRSSMNWHPEETIWWAILAFDPEILGHDGVHFATSNNAYPSTQRGAGLVGIKATYADAVPWGMYGSVARRNASTPTSNPTHEQAEVLYPRSIDLAYLRTIYVAEDRHIDDVAGWIAAFAVTDRVDLTAVDIRCAPELFVQV